MIVELENIWGYGYMSMLDVDISDTGCAMLGIGADGCDDSIYYIEDAIERFMQEIDICEREISELYYGHDTLMKMELDDPTGLDYEREHSFIESKIRHYKAREFIFRKDLEVLLGAQVPF